jgi:hypothetical protein
VEPHIFGKGVLAVQTVKAALVAAIAIVALVVSLLPGLADHRDFDESPLCAQKQSFPIERMRRHHCSRDTTPAQKW